MSPAGAGPIDRAAVEALVRAALKERGDARASDNSPGSSTGTGGATPTTATSAAAVAAARTTGGVARHIDPPRASALGMLTGSGGEVLLRPSTLVNPHNPAALRAITGSTVARVAVGRAGTRYTTATLLKFRADHAAAKEAVLAAVSQELLDRLGFIQVRTRAENKRHFLQRPDAGRALSDEGRQTVVDKLPRAPQLQIIYGDGLSGEAINVSLEPLHTALLSELSARGIKPNPPLFIHLSRVKVMDEVARLLECESAVFICGERPGLGFADSLSAYFIYRPATGATDADREVISNINPRGFPPAQAAVQLADSIVRILREKKSGVVLG